MASTDAELAAAARPHAVLYAAKSTEDVHGSIATQLADCRELAEAEGYDVVDAFSDTSASAYKGNRGPGLEAAMRYCEEKRAALVVQHSDRLARGDGRTSRHLVEYALRAKKHDITIYSVQDRRRSVISSTRLSPGSATTRTRPVRAPPPATASGGARNGAIPSALFRRATPLRPRSLTASRPRPGSSTTSAWAASSCGRWRWSRQGSPTATSAVA